MVNDPSSLALGPVDRWGPGDSRRRAERALLHWSQPDLRHGRRPQLLDLDPCPRRL